MTASGTTTPGNPGWRARFAVYTALLFGSWYFNAPGLPETALGWNRCEPRVGYIGPDSTLVVTRLARPELPAFHPLVYQTATLSFEPYRSQLGLQGVVLTPVRAATGADPQALAAAFALLTAAVVAGVFVTAHRRLGPPTGDVACGLAALAPAFLPFAPSLYWVPFLCLAPFALVWCLYPRATTPRRRLALLAGVAVGVLLKALCGYEHITAVVLGPVAAAWFHQHRAAEPLGRRLGFAVGLLAAGAVGFALAMAAHAAQVETVLGEDGVALIRERALGRTVGEVWNHDTAPDLPPGKPGFATVARCFRDYFRQPAASTGSAFRRVRKEVPLAALVAAVGAFAVAAAVGRRVLPRDAGALAGAAVLALAASVSWLVLAVNHMCTHRHLNGVVFAYPFLPVAFLTIGYVGRLATRGGRWLGPAVLVGVAGLMAANVAAWDRADRTGKAEQERAEALVAARLGDPTGAVEPWDGGCVDSCQPLAKFSHPALLELGQLDPVADRAKDPGAVLVKGWAVGRVVVVVGSAVVPCEVTRWRRPDIDALFGRPSPGVGFQAVVPSAAVGGGPVRVFVVSRTEPARVAELAVPR